VARRFRNPPRRVAVAACSTLHAAMSIRLPPIEYGLQTSGGGTKCPHCATAFFPAIREWALTHSTDPSSGFPLKDSTGTWHVQFALCPACRRAIIYLVSKNGGEYRAHLVWPAGASRPLPKEVPKEYAKDFQEACAVLTASPKASAALSRRLLQRILREKGGVKKADLYNEIEEVLPKLPADLADVLHAVRVVGKYAAHPEKSTNTGEIIDVEPGEADLSLDILEDLLDYYCVRPARTAARIKTTNTRLRAAGKGSIPGGRGPEAEPDGSPDETEAGLGSAEPTDQV
jgi:hypothetical protein